MKKWIALILALVLCLSLGACGDTEATELYEKYQDLIEALEDDDTDAALSQIDENIPDQLAAYEKHRQLLEALESKNYTGVINQIASLSYADKQASKEPGPEPVQVLSQPWFASEENYKVQSLSFHIDGSCTIDDTEMTWTENQAEDTWMNGYIFQEGTVKYVFEVRLPNENRSLPSVSLWTAKEGEYGINSDDHVGDYYNHEMIPVLSDYWRQLTMFEDLPENISIYNGSTYFLDTEYFWAPAENTDGLLTARAYSRKGDVSTEFTLTLAERDGYRVLYITNNDTGTQALYYTETNEEKLYDTSWPEAIYRTARRALNSYVNGYSLNVDGQYLSDNDARAYIYGQFSLVSDYLDSADYLARFSILPSLLTNITEVNTDQLDQVRTNELYACWYTQDGRLEYEKGEAVIENYGITSSGSKQWFLYDDTGKIASIRTGYKPEDYSAIATPTYDEAGRIVGMTVQTGSEAYTASFTYNDQGQLINSETRAGDYYGRTYTYTYDDAGLLIQKVYTKENNNFTVTEDYTYENGNLIQINATHKYRYSDPYTTQTVFTLDDQNRPISAVFTSTHSNYSYKSTTLEYVYQDIYFLDTTGLVTE